MHVNAPPTHRCSVCTVVFSVQGWVDEAALELWIQSLIWEHQLPDAPDHTIEVMRLKGVAAVRGNARRVVYQSVNEFFDKAGAAARDAARSAVQTETTAWGDAAPISRFVVIGAWHGSAWAAPKRRRHEH